MLIIAAGNGLGVRLGSELARLAVLTGWIAVGKSPEGDSSQRQNTLSSLVSQLLQLPITASAKTPRVGMLIRIGGTGVLGA